MKHEGTATARIAEASALGEMCDGHPENVDGVLPRVLALLDGETDIAVLTAIVDALGRMWDHRCVAPLLPLTEHPDRGVRLAATHAMHGALYNNDDRAGVEALLRLTRDADAEIRDWATFALAQSDADSPQVRAALRERVDDPDGDTAGEALVGLARRRDVNAEARIAELLADKPGNLIVEAAAELGSPALHPLLVRLRNDGWQDDDARPDMLDEALERCDPIRSDD